MFIYCLNFGDLGRKLRANLNDSIHHYETNPYRILKYGQHPLTNGKTFPHFRVNQTRYAGEDARFVCNWIIEGLNTSTPHVNQAVWYKDGIMLTPDERHNFSWTFEFFENTCESCALFRFTSYLEITMIDERDFGVYNCHVSSLTVGIKDSESCNTQSTLEKNPNDQYGVSAPESKEVEQMFKDFYGYNWAGEYRLVKENSRTETISIFPGSFLSIATYYRHLTNKDEYENITLQYMVNNKKPPTESRTCSLVVLMYYFFINNGKVRSLLSVMQLSELMTVHFNSTSEWKGIYSIIRQCMSPSLYGLHSIVVQRSFFNKTLGAMVTRNFSHPVKYNIIPKPSGLFYFTDALTNTEIFDINCWNSEEISQSQSCKTIYLLLEYMANHVLLTNIIVTIVIIVICCLLYVLKEWLIYLLWPLRMVEPVETLAHIPARKELKYHVFLSYSDSDREFVQQVLLPLLKKLDIQVFDPFTDIDLGKIRISATGEGITQSAAFLILASTDYVQNIFNNQHEINMILDSVRGKNLLVIKISTCVIPDVFENRYTLIDSTGKKSVPKCKEALLKWIYSNFKLRPILGGLSFSMPVFFFGLFCLAIAYILLV
ncbi:hypothetical protein SNE40_022306 [Patella caerulea]|uniref:TIR domain-containing protein n=1 Tax=Patella caerulea TaxID=87958 RepID=A0AAN8J3W4_PATCE